MEVNVGRLEDLPVDRCVAVAGGRAVVARLAEQVVAFENRCLHQDSPLAGGRVSGEVLTCPMHFWRYRLPEGVTTGSGSRLTSYPVTVRAGEVFVDLPDEVPGRSMREILLDHARSWAREGKEQM